MLTLVPYILSSLPVHIRIQGAMVTRAASSHPPLAYDEAEIPNAFVRATISLNESGHVSHVPTTSSATQRRVISELVDDAVSRRPGTPASP